MLVTLIKNMKQNLLFFALGLLMTIAISATTVSMMTVKPANPVTTLAFYGNPNEIQSKILDYSKKGYIVKTVSPLAGNTNIDSYKTIFVIMERY